jgi:beta-1,4-mannosyl-glycoprotein beta-1,4-N-acetylglucosaminyltransferase
MVFDCFTFFNELDILEIRLNTLNDVVDKFVLVEATKTHQGNDKPLFYNENKSRYAAFADKIIHVIIDTFPAIDASSAWTLERYQREMIAEGLKTAKPGDTILISDVDEIPDPEKIKAFKNKSGIKIFCQRSFYYFINCINTSNSGNYAWCGTIMASYNSKISPQTLRYISIQFLGLYSDRLIVRMYSRLKILQWKIKLMQNIYTVENGGWHFSFLGGVEKIIKKLEAFAHSEYNTAEYKDPKKIEQALDEGRDIFGRDFTYKFVPLDDTFPTYIVKNREKYKNLIRENKSA